MTSPNILKWVSSFALTFALAALIQYWIGDGDQSIGAIEWLGIPVIAAAIRLFVWSIDHYVPSS
jgi:hypothetical protein